MSYVKGVDWYLITSFLFIFLSLVECVVVEKLESSASKERASKESGQENEDLVIKKSLVAHWLNFAKKAL